MVYSGSVAPLAALHSNVTRSFYYCHALPRFIYDLRDYYMRALPHWQRPLLSALIQYIQPRYEKAISRIHALIANSENVRSRILRYLGRDSVVIHPPCDTKGFTWLESGDYFLSTARLEPYKRVDLVVSAFLQMPECKLVVASGGSDESRLFRMAENAPNIRFVGWQSAGALRELIGRSRATIYIPLDEDFGMSPVESMAAGKPVIGVAEGGLLETVLPEETGFLLGPKDLEQQLMDTVRNTTPEHFQNMRSECEERAKQFSSERFVSAIRKTVDLV
ncbi:glycosyltransferase [Thiocapsa marina]|uniref:Glycosyl transferase group 1 n=1 Tax=Thiocapsa marina 5811 TaxID=768671 RepID=F9UIK1_9GAMM|nr:glycosyltransferase [Thiocapsa marina]EGV15955.1 glycosyl transferase group 1 [Thiocapsa marina 5811]